MTRTTNLVAEPGDKVEVRFTVKAKWREATVVEAMTMWIQADGKLLPGNFYKVRLAGCVYEFGERSIRKPQAEQQ